MKRILLPLCITLSLSGCMTTALVATGATAGGSVIYDKRSITTQVNDQKMRFAAQEAIHRLPAIHKNSHIGVSVFDGVLLLVGQTPYDEYRQQALNAATRSSHFKRSYNRITIAQPASIKQMSKDTWITTKVKAAMLSEEGLQSSQIKVVTEDNTVYLMGLVSQQQANMATAVSRQVPGVNKVVKLFEYVS